MRTESGGLPPFSFPVVAWAPEPATGDPCDDGIREFLTARHMVTNHFAEQDLRLGWTFVDVEGRCWEAVSSRVVGRADPFWIRALPEWIHHPQYRLAYEFAQRPPVSFDKVKSRLFAAVTANPQAYEGWYGPSRRRELRAAKSLSDLIKSKEALAIERLQPTSLLWQWLFWEGRCSRRGFVAAVAGIVVAWPVALKISYTAAATAAMATVTLIGGASAVIRRLHDLSLSGWWIASWWAWSLLCAWINELAPHTGGSDVAFWLWWIPTPCLLGWLALWPGVPGPNRYGYGRRAPPQEPG